LEAAKVLSEMAGGQAVEPSAYVPEHKRRYIRETAAKAWGEIGSQQAVDALIHALNDEDSGVGSYAAEALRSIGTPDTLEKILQSPRIDIYDPEIFSTARTLAVRFSEEETPFIPVYPELIAKHKP
jgi:HEAT repeat protein